MLFPEAPRVVYRKNPLDLVVTQLRFPPILRISRDSPADFQERIRDQFPNYSKTQELTLEMPFSPLVFSGGGGGIRPALEDYGCRHQFISEDGKRKITLGQDTLSFMTREYERWETFSSVLMMAFDALCELYRPKHFLRVGLRYVDVLRRERLRLNGTPWTKLLRPSILGIMGEDITVGDVKRFENQCELDLDNSQGRIRMRTFCGKYPAMGEEVFVIDSDFFVTGKIVGEEAMNRLDFLNQQASRLIRWCITDDLHQAMEPEST
ncbi:MAG: TIGR04255 family protein [Thermodesulfobacteriota bacterium]